jgi:F-type H+-transporting ATPase subunit a
MSNLLRLDRQPTDVAPPVLDTIAGVPLTNTLLTALVITIILAGFGFYWRNRFRVIPGWFQNAMELVYDQMVRLIKQITGSEEKAEAILPAIAAIFVYIGVANLLTILPGLSSITFDGTTLLRAPTSDINLPLALGLVSMIVIQIEAIRVRGPISYFGRFFRFKELAAGFSKGVKAGSIALVKFFVGFLDIIAEAAKVISLSFRLFGNMFAGELLAVLILSAFAYGLPALWLSMNLLFSVVQALVFGALVAGYYTLAVRKQD